MRPHHFGASNRAMQTVSNKSVYDSLTMDLQSWIGSNRRTNKYITRHNLKYLFEFSDSRELTIDLCRFDVGYYTKVFTGIDSLKMSEEFVKKACVVMRETLKRAGKPELDITISVKHKVSKLTHWQSYFITHKFTAEAMKPLVRKPDER